MSLLSLSPLRPPRYYKQTRRGPGHSFRLLLRLVAFAVAIIIFNNDAGNKRGVASIIYYAAATIPCQPDRPDSDPTRGDALCAEKYRIGSYCVPRTPLGDAETKEEVESGTCSNPFLSGCLRNYLGEETFGKKRACNSDDDDGAAERGECEPSQFEYEEVRILSQNWEGAMFSAWIMQIVLSELLGVPTTIETGADDKDGSLNFYDPAIRFSYSSVTYDYDALRAARNNGGKCQQFQAERAKRNEPYEACAHVITEIWNGQQENLVAVREEGLIEPTIGTGGVGKFSWYVPYFTAKKDPSLLSYIGLVSADDLTNRRKLAKTFLRPRTWKQFCEDVSVDNCTSPYYDEEDRLIATRPPADMSEAGKYFLSGSFHGHFAPTEENDCEQFPFNCTGHLANVQCDWSTFADSQAFHTNIPVKSSGPNNAGGYSYGSMIEIYHASNYTKSDILSYWYTPESYVLKFLGTDAEFLRVLLPTSTEECKETRLTQDQRCTGNTGDTTGSCDSEAHSLQKAIVSNLKPSAEVSDAMQSPAYDAIKSVKISDLQQEKMFRKWLTRKADSNYDARHSVCLWAAENLSLLQRWIPESYPRSIVVQKFDQGVSYVALCVAAFVLILAGAVFGMTWKNRTKAVFIYAQVNILFMLLVGIALVCVGAILFAVVPTNGTCIARPWFVVLGNTLQIVPLIVKVAAINRIFQAANSLTRVRIKAKHLYMIASLIAGLVAIYLLVWTLVDPMSLVSINTLTEDTNDDGAQIVEVTYSCASKSSYWLMFSFVYQFLLLVAASVLAFQNRKAKFEFNESLFLSLVVYSHFMFTLLRGVMYLLQAKLEAHVISTASSFLLSGDAMATLSIYFFPKFARMNSIVNLVTPRQPRGPEQNKRTTVSDIRRRATQNNDLNGVPANPSLAGRLSTVTFRSCSLQNESQQEAMDVETGPSLEEGPQIGKDGIKSAKENAPKKITENNSVACADVVGGRDYESKNVDTECRHDDLDDPMQISEDITTDFQDMFRQESVQKFRDESKGIDHVEALYISKLGNMRSEMQVKPDSAGQVAMLHEKNRLLNGEIDLLQDEKSELLKKRLWAEVESQTLRKRTALLHEENGELKRLLDTKQHNR